MASDHDTMTMHEDDQDDDYADEDDYDHDHYQHQRLPYTLSRLSMCTSKSDYSMYDNMDEHGHHEDMSMYIGTRLSMEASSDDDDDDDGNRDQEGKGSLILSSDSYDDHGEPPAGCYSLPATPRRRKSSLTHEGDGSLVNYLNDVVVTVAVEKEYVSENEADRRLVIGKKKKRNSRRRMVRERWLERAWEKKKTLDEDDEEMMIRPKQEKNSSSYSDHHRFSGDAHHHHHHQSNNNLVILTRPSGGRRSLCMDLEEVQACRDLGFELEHEKMMLDLSISSSSRISVSGSNIDTTTASSGGNSPIANWRISSPGDDPKDVKARIKVWAQAVALASASHSRLLS